MSEAQRTAPTPLVAESQAVAAEVVSDAEARRIDTAMYAEFHGLSIEEADTQIRQREELQTLLDDAESEKGYGFGDFVTAPRGRAGTIRLSVGMVTGDEAAFLPDVALEPNVDLTIQSGPTSEDEGD